MFSKEIMASYEKAVVELHKLEEKLVKATKKYDKWAEIALACESDEEMFAIADKEVCPAWQKVLKLKEKVKEAKFNLDKVKARMAWSERLGKYKKPEDDDSWGFEMVRYN